MSNNRTAQYKYPGGKEISQLITITRMTDGMVSSKTQKKNP
jgi:hypothetical protein